MNSSTLSQSPVSSEQDQTELPRAERKPMSFLEEMLLNAEHARRTSVRLRDIQDAMATSSSANGTG